jgi:hypothetical protein
MKKELLNSEKDENFIVKDIRFLQETILSNAEIIEDLTKQNKQFSLKEKCLK